ncbi:MAG TPA: hypothetical protein DDW65_03870 [Firmicutes bacterium]|jgi:DNA-binding LacI/PurR family transcriptional regulator|nr:hypothetical protein [Bacillota bacterium]
MINIKTVAKKAGVSPTTASYALNNRAGVKPETVEKVLRAARELNYIPNSLAQSFRNGKSNTIAVVTHENLEDYSIFSLELMGIILKARELDYDVLVKSLPQDSELHSNEMMQIINGRKADGVILLGNGFEELIGQFKAEIHKMILLSSHSKFGISEVNVNGGKGIYTITEYLIKKGYSTICYLTFALDTTEELNRERGYRKALAAYDLSSKENIIACGYNSKAIYETVIKLMETNPPEAIVCWNDLLALQVINALKEMGKKIPEDIAVTGFDDIIQDLNYIPHLTTIKQPFTEKGKCAMKLLADIIENKVKGPVKQEVECTLVVRESA